ncbi:receptor-like protein 6 [Eucalyptus grandis]|uniref:receptor-like protein 6 n=1 Tax=Eucalyptus grandis TaxID=71139 RepID=UPI00192E7FA2|nr:receptor-like protein 6 [Eucalyptus grandis]
MASTSAQCPGVDQRSLLLELKNSLIFDSFKSSKLVRWDRSTDSWSGVTCEDGLVVGLDLSKESISGGIDNSSSLFRLEFLQSLNLAFNDFDDTAIPLDLANLSRLAHLNLSNTGFTMHIPAELSRLTKLRTLDLSFFCNDDELVLNLERNLSSLIGDMRELRELYLDGVILYTEGSEWYNTLSSSVPKLEVLSMSYCSVYGPIDPSLMSLANLSVQTLQILELSTNELLQGSLPEFLENGSLKTLVLSDTHISGRLPDSIGNLRNLSRIELANCNFHGNIPSSFTNLLRLSYLDFSFNNFTGPIPSFSKSKNLTQVTLSHNSLIGPIDSTQWESLSSLLILDLGFNLLEGNIPSSLFTHPSIRELLLSDNRFSSQLKGFFDAPSHMLQKLDLSNNNIGGELPTSIWELRGLNYLLLSSNNFSGSFHINWVQQLRNLSNLDLSYNRFSIDTTNTASQAFSFPNLTSLNLASCQLTTLPQFLANQSKLSSLDLSNNYIEGTIPRWIPNIIFLTLSKNNFHGFIPPSICKAINLEVLDLSHNHLSGTIPDCLMESLDGQIPLSLASCTALEFVNIGDNQIDGTFPCHFMAMSRLRVLVLRSNKLYGEIGCPHSHNTWQMLQIIDLSSNDFGGTLPVSLLASLEAMKANKDFNHLQYQFLDFYDDELYYEDTMSATLKDLRLELVKIWTIFTLIDFSSNKLEGLIPNTLGDLKALYALNLSHNVISGSIPPILGNLHKIESLDLSVNYLNGSIPPQLANLDFLSLLNLSNNRLVGNIPTSGQFLTFSKSSFEGNLGLCGLLLNKSCSITTNGMEEVGDNGDDDDSEKKWFYMGIPLGFVIGFWVFCGPLMFMRSWRFAYYRFWDKVLFKFLRP